jgi:hypothetical protein
MADVTIVSLLVEFEEIVINPSTKSDRIRSVLRSAFAAGAGAAWRVARERVLAHDADGFNRIRGEIEDIAVAERFGRMHNDATPS